MPTLTLNFSPTHPTLSLLPEPQLCYVLLSVGATGLGGARPVNWALIADASRSMRIPIVDEAQFRALVRDGGAQETLVDGVPVWQLTAPVPPDIRATSLSALDQVARALHSVVEHLGPHDRFALIACAEEALLLTRSASGADQAELARGIARLKSLNLGEQTDLARGIEMGLLELRHGRDTQRAERLLLLTDGFTLHPEACLQLASTAADEGIAISTVGLGGEFQEEVLTALADRSGGRACFLHRPKDIPQAITAELLAARTVAARAVTLQITPIVGATLRRVTRIRPSLTTLYENHAPAPITNQLPPIPLGDLESATSTTLLLELLAPPQSGGRIGLTKLTLTSDDTATIALEIPVTYQAYAPAPPPEVLDAAARASAARLQRRAVEAATRGATTEAVRLLRAAAERLSALGEHALADAARLQATTLERTGRTAPLDTKELTYATRRLGEHT